jgi:hypothetical protein
VFFLSSSNLIYRIASSLPAAVRYMITVSIALFLGAGWWFGIHRYNSDDPKRLERMIEDYRNQYTKNLKLLESYNRPLSEENSQGILLDIMDCANSVGLQISRCNKVEKSLFLSAEFALIELTLEGDFHSMIEFFQSLTLVQGVRAWNSYTLTNTSATQVRLVGSIEVLNPA